MHEQEIGRTENWAHDDTDGHLMDLGLAQGLPGTKMHVL